jgi:hypothetical protein
LLDLLLMQMACSCEAIARAYPGEIVVDDRGLETGPVEEAGLQFNLPPIVVPQAKLD